MVHRYRKKMGGVHFITQIRSGPLGLYPTAFGGGLAQTLGQQKI